MPKFLFQGSNYGEGLKGLAVEGGRSRVEAPGVSGCGPPGRPSLLPGVVATWPPSDQRP